VLGGETTTAPGAGTSTPDGVLRRPEIAPGFLGDQVWDGRIRFAYVPPPAPELRIDDGVKLHSEFDLDLDPVTYQVLRNRFWSINLDHSDTIRRVSGSPVIVYMDDFNTALLTETGDLLMAGPSIQWFAAIADLPIKWTLENRSANPGIYEGDVYFTNDPWVGCIHAMDVGMFAPVFWEGRIFSWIFSQCHVGDVGGPFPGSFNPIAESLYEEATLVPPSKLVERGEIRMDTFEMHTRKSRTPDHLALQLRSQIAGIHTVQTRMAEVLDDYGPAVVKGAMRRMIRDSSRAIGDRLLRIPDGIWEERIYMAGLGASDRSAHRFAARLRKEGDQLVFGNEGTDEQYGSANSVYGTWRSGAIVALSNFVGWDQLLCNAGALDHLTFEPTAGTLTVPVQPAATTGVGGNNASVYLPSFVVSKMLACGPPDLQKRANAAGGSAVVSFWFGAGLDRRGNFAVSAPGDVVAGALGAFPHRDGVDIGGAWWWPNNPSGNVEEWEDALPILYLYRRERPSSGGPGTWRGGNALETAVVLHRTEEMLVQLVSLDQAINCAVGLGGGLPGHPGDYRFKAGVTGPERFAAGWMAGSGAELEELAGELPRVFAKDTTNMRPGDVFVAQYNGGGGFGDPLVRAPSLVARDVALSSVLPDDAEGQYGVVLNPDGQVDVEGTAACRRSRLETRLALAEPPAQRSDTRLAVEEMESIIPGAAAIGRLESGEALWACPNCRQGLAALDANFKDGAARLELELQVVSPSQYPDPKQFCDDPFVMRRYLCPSCGIGLSTELCRPDDPPVIDVRLRQPAGVPR
jgi:N-methylhydantoinase B